MSDLIDLIQNHTSGIGDQEKAIISKICIGLALLYVSSHNPGNMMPIILFMTIIWITPNIFSY
jgi:hypothetical protein